MTTEVWREWHQHYDDPASGLSWRLAQVQAWFSSVLDGRTGPVRVLSLCAGDGRDVLDVLAARHDAHRMSVTLVELDPVLAERARQRAAAAGLNIDVRTADAGTTSSFFGAVPADVVLLVGIFGNITDDDVRRTVSALPHLCAPRAQVIWSRGRNLGSGDPTDHIRRWVVESGCTELDFLTRDSGSRPSLGTARFDGTPRDLISGVRLFEFRTDLG